MEFCKYGSLLSYLRKNRTLFVNQIDPVTYQIETKINKDQTLAAQSEVQTSEQIQDSNQPPQDTYHGDYQPQDATSMTTTDLLSWAYQIAKGMEYLSSKKVQQICILKDCHLVTF